MATVFVCTLHRCFLPTVFLKRGVLPEEEVLAVVVNAGQVCSRQAAAVASWLFLQQH